MGIMNCLRRRSWLGGKDRDGILLMDSIINGHTWI